MKSERSELAAAVVEAARPFAVMHDVATAPPLNIADLLAQVETLQEAIAAYDRAAK